MNHSIIHSVNLVNNTSKIIPQSLLQDNIEIENHYTSVKYIYKNDNYTELSFASNHDDYLLTVAITTDSHVYYSERFIISM